MQDEAVEYGGKIMTQQGYDQALKEMRDKVMWGLSTMRDEWVQYRAQSGVEDRWRKANNLYLGDTTDAEDAFTQVLKTGPRPASSRQPQNRSRVVINIVRPKVDQAVARMCEILLPVDDPNWGILPTPVPQLVANMLGKDVPTVIPGTNVKTGMTADQEARLYVDAAKAAAKEMQTEIADQLTECSYNGEQRKGIENGVKLGTMIMKGPFPSRQTSKAWQHSGGRAKMVVNESTVPASMSCDPWDVWFDPACGNDHQRGRGYWHRRFVTRKELRRLVGIPGYDTEAIRQVLREAPSRVRVAEGRVTRLACKEESYELWEYHGEVEPDDMLMCSLSTGDPLEDVEFGVLLMVNDKVIGAMPSWVVDGTLPMDVWCWRKSDDSPYGYGLPAEMEHQQRVVNGAWRQVMDNARVTLGGQIVFNRKGVRPYDGQYEITPNKLWEAQEGVDDIKKAFEVYNFESRIQELLMVAEKAMQYSDQETSMPQLLGGEKGGAPETVGGMLMLYNTANGVLRMRVKLYDDAMTRPHISRYYDWNMANNPKENIKGDMEVDARGSTALLEKDIQNQATLNLANITANPRYQAFLDPRKEIEIILKAFKLQPADVMFDEDRIKQNLEKPPAAPPDPRIAAAEMNLKAKEMDIADSQAQREFEAMRNQIEAGLKDKQIEYNKDREQAEFEIAMTEASLTRDGTLLKIDSAERIAQSSQAARERMELLKIDTDRQLFNAEAALRTQTGAGI